jgi:alkylation response protein AidB-like acyl-CoA dehydrogenase
MFDEHSLPDHLREVKSGVRRIVESQLEPLAAEIDRTGEIPGAVMEILRRYGLLGMQLPEEYGGGNLDVAAYLLSIEELARSHRVFAAIAGRTSGGPALAMVRYGTIEQKERWLRGIANGTIVHRIGADRARRRLRRRGN